MIERIDTGGGCIAWMVTEPDVPGFLVMVTDESGCRLPEDPENDTVIIGVYADDLGEALRLIEVKGRAGAIAWFIEHVGYDPDEDAKACLPMTEYYDRIGSWLLLDSDPNRDKEKQGD